MEPVFCPNPRRLTQLSGADPVRPIRWHPCDSRPGADVLDIILSKGSHGGIRGEQHAGEAAVASSPPPYFCGSPPSRASNPLVLDARFCEEKATLLTPLPALAAPSRSPGGARQGRVRASFGPKPAAVRVEGFDCLGGEGRRSGCGITAVA